MRKIAFYGKGGIGKSTTASNVSAALSLMGKRVCQIGCDPKNDSTRLLLGHICQSTVLDILRTRDTGDIRKEDIIHTGFNGITCVEAGGPEPGGLCRPGNYCGSGASGSDEGAAGKRCHSLRRVGRCGLWRLCHAYQGRVCRGNLYRLFRELMSLYAANNIAKGIARFASRGKVRLAGIIGNSRNVPGRRNCFWPLQKGFTPIWPPLFPG